MRVLSVKSLYHILLPAQMLAPFSGCKVTYFFIIMQ